MQHHSFLFHPADDELIHYISAIEKVEAQEKFQGTVAIDIQRHGGHWTGEFSAVTSRKLMDFITEVTMELPPEETEDEGFQLTADGPVEEDPIKPEAYEKLHEAIMSDETDEEEEYEQTDEEYEHEEGTPAQPSGQIKPKKLKKPTGVAKTPNSAITVEED